MPHKCAIGIQLNTGKIIQLRNAEPLPNPAPYTYIRSYGITYRVHASVARLAIMNTMRHYIMTYRSGYSPARITKTVRDIRNLWVLTASRIHHLTRSQARKVRRKYRSFIFGRTYVLIIA